MQKDINECISISLAVVASIQGTHCHISMFLKQIDKKKRYLLPQKQTQRKGEDCKPPSTSIMIDINGTESEEAWRSQFILCVLQTQAWLHGCAST